MRTINVGELVHAVTVQEGTDGVDGGGAPAQTWADLDTVMMARQAGVGGEAFRGEQLSAAVQTVWTLRYWSEVDPDLVDVPKTRRLVYQGRIYDIVSADVMDRRVGIVLRTLAQSRVEA